MQALRRIKPQSHGAFEWQHSKEKTASFNSFQRAALAQPTKGSRQKTASLRIYRTGENPPLALSPVKISTKNWNDAHVYQNLVNVDALNKIDARLAAACHDLALATGHGRSCTCPACRKRSENVQSQLVAKGRLRQQGGQFRCMSDGGTQTDAIGMNDEVVVDKTFRGE